MSITKLRPTFTVDQERLDALRAIIPEAFADGKINWDTLREALGEHLEDEGRDTEHFGLFWPGKREARRLASQPSAGTLKPAPGEGVNEEATRHIFIEGDNLEVLKLLQKSYAGRVKMIYIDPPYNRGEDLIYRDDYGQPLEEYFRLTEQVDDSGALLVTNTRASGRFHSNWLNMMYPRLRLAKNLLCDDGVIFVSVDDNEFHYVRMVMDEVFGEECFLGTFTWQSKKGGGSDKGGVVNDQEYVVCFARRSDSKALSHISIEAEPLDKHDEKGPYRRGREVNKWGSNSRREDRPNLYYAVPGPQGEDVYPIRNDGSQGCWRWQKKKMLQVLERGDLEFAPRNDGTYIVYEKIRSTDTRTKPYRTWLTDVGRTADGSDRIKMLFGGIKVFDYPKPVNLIKHFLEMGTTGDEDIVLDFFAGSCTTAEAIMKVNCLDEDEGIRRFICVQWPEPIPEKHEARKAGYHTICEVGKERIRRSIVHLRKDAGESLLSSMSVAQDLGFRVFKLGRSHFKTWHNYEGQDVVELQTLFDRFEYPLADNWQPADMLVEIMLLEGFPLDSTTTHLAGFVHNSVTQVASDLVDHRLYVCLDSAVRDETIEALVMDENDMFICLDSALSDETKVRLEDGRQVKVI